MKLNRRTFLKSSSILVGSIILQGSKDLQMTPLLTEKIKSIGDTVGIYTEKGGTIGWYVEGDAIVVIDSQFPDSVENFKNELSRKSSRKINYLLNTHHHRDHTLGNFYLKEFTENIVAHSNCPRLQKLQNKGKETEKQVVIANITFEDKINISLPKEKLVASHFGQAHTGGDIVVHFENANIAHLGDLVFNNVYPYIDNEGECSVANWIKVLDRINNYFDDSTKFIFGHANNTDSVVGNKQDVTRMRNYLESLYNYVEKMTKNGKSIIEIADTDYVPDSDSIIELWKGARKMNLTAMAEQFR